ncbi:hypothetical protein [Hydrogenophaga sp. RWCD_12]|uniref:hypothetical protein n=1 Tax=Hydrogenophaga sp. RWCD_12 TaxID=3391190 RepID=UPI00398562D5
MKALDTSPQNDQLVAPDKRPGRRLRVALYVLLCVAASLVPPALELANYPALESGALDFVRALGGLLALAVLTFPVGIVPVALWVLMVIPGIATPFEAVGALLPVFAFLGYKQWFVWIPKLVQRRSKTDSR